jgi:hypothetical protein
MLPLQDIVIFAVLSGLALSRKARETIAFQLVKAFDYVSQETDLLRIPMDTNGEALLIACGSIAFYITKTKNLRRYPLSHPENQNFFKTMAIGIMLGLLMDLY